MFVMLTIGAKVGRARMSRKPKSRVITARSPGQRSSGKPFKVVYERAFQYWVNLRDNTRQYITPEEVEAMRDTYEVLIITTVDDFRKADGKQSY